MARDAGRDRLLRLAARRCASAGHLSAYDRLGHGSTVWLQDLDEAKPLRHAMHVDVSVARDHVEERVEAALAAGGRVIDESGAPAHWILSDRAGNRVCICAWPDGARSPALDGPVGI